MKEECMTFGEKIADARKSAGLSQKELAEKLDISPQYLNDIEHGKRNPASDELIESFSRALGLDAAVLYYLARRLSPSDVKHGIPDDRVVAAYKAFRKALK